MAPNGGTAPSRRLSLWSGPATGNTGSLNLVDTEEYFTKSEDLTQSSLDLDQHFCTYRYNYVKSLTCNMLQAGVCEFAT